MNKKIMVLVAVVILTALSAFLISGGISGNVIGFSQPRIDNIYSEFTCDCCQDSLADSGCLTALGMKYYLNSLALDGMNKDEIILKGVKRFGLNSLENDKLKEKLSADFLVNPPEDRPILKIKPEEVNLGEVRSSNRVIMITFTLRNEGNSDLILYYIGTSCDCMSADIVVDGDNSPRFGRFTESQGWLQVIKPGGSSQLRAFWDPQVNTWFRGHADRLIYIDSNDPVTPHKQVKIEYIRVD